MKERLFRLLNLKVSESKYVFDLLSIQLFIGIANSFINIVSFTFFIHYFSVSSIAYAYMAIALVLSFLNLGYEKLEKRLSPLHLLRWIIVCSSMVLLVFWTGFLTVDKGFMIFALLVLGTLFYMVTGYAYWGLVSLLFNVRESRRVFSIVGSGDIPAKLIGYASAPLLISVIGLQNLLLVSIASLVVGFLLLNKLIHKKRWERISQRSHHHHEKEQIGHENRDSIFSFFFKHKLIFTISLLSLLSYNVFNLIDYTFVTQIKAKVKDLSSLATYIAIFFAAGRLVALFMKLVFTSRLIERLGVISCLLITPIALALFSSLFIFFNEGISVLYIFGVMAMLTEVLRSAMQEPVFFILFQPLNEHHRLRGHIIAKGYMLAPSLFIVGASLVLMQQLGIELTINFTIVVLLLNLIIWTGIIIYIKKAYARALHQSIARGIYSGETIKINDAATISILLDKIKKGSLAEKVYALKLLEKSDYAGINQLLEQQLQSGSPEVKKYALQRLEKKGALNQKLLENLVYIEKDNAVKEQLIASLCRHDHEFLRSFSRNLSGLDHNIRKSVIIQLLNQSEFDYLYKAGSEINSLLQSKNPKDRELALEIISELKNIKFTEAIELLINDGDSSVKRNAIIAACKLRSKTILPMIFEHLDTPSGKFMAIQGLFQYGDSLFNDILAFDQEIIDRHKPDLVKIAAKIKGPLSTRFLLNCLTEKNANKEKIIHVLWIKGFQAEKVDHIFLFEHLLNDYLKNGQQKISYHISVPVFHDHELVKRSIGSEIWNDLTTALKICGILYPKKEINRVIELVENRDRHKLYNGMEMLEMVLPKKTARQLNELFDYLLDPLYSKKRVIEKAGSNFLEELVCSPEPSFNHWTKAMCLYVSLKNNQLEFIRKLKHEPEPNENIVLTETRAFVFSSIQQADYVNH